MQVKKIFGVIILHTSIYLHCTWKFQIRVYVCITAGGYYGEEEGSVAIIACTNLGLFKEVKNFCEKDSESKIAFAGGIEGYEYETILEMYDLKDGKGVNEDIENFSINSWSALAKQASNGKNPQLKWKKEVFFLRNNMYVPIICMYHQCI